MKLLEAQRTIAAALMRPSRQAKSQAAALIKPNDRLTSFERLDIYSRSYWARLIDSLRDDFPGLLAILDAKAFERLAEAYLRDVPSTSFTLRDLGSKLEGWLMEHPRFAGTNHDLAMDMVRLEWAHIVAFDGLSVKALAPEDLAELKPTLRLGLQPYISLLTIRYPVDEFRVRVNSGKHPSKRLKPETGYLAIHRLDSVVHYKRLTTEEYRLLKAFSGRCSIGKALLCAIKSAATPDVLRTIETSFAAWAQFGWLTAVAVRRKRGIIS